MYEDRTPENIKAEIAADLQSNEAHQRNGAWETREGSFADDQAGPMALQLSNVYASFNALESIVWVNETSGKYIDMAANDLGVESRKPGTKAQVMLLVIGEPGFAVSAGTTFLTAAGLTFVTIESAIIADDSSITIQAEATESGRLYNVVTNSITSQFDNSAQITAVANPEPATGGTDAETDAELFARVDFARKRPRTSGNKAHYEEWALEVDGVGVARAFPIRYGRGTVMVLIADAARKPVAGAIIDKCYEHIESEMPAGGIELTVKTPTEIVVNVSAILELDGAATIDSIRLDYIARLQNHFSDIAMQTSILLYNYVGALLIGTNGVKNYSDLTLNGQTADIVFADEEIPTLGEVVIA